MRKPLKEGSTGFKTGTGKIKILIVFLVFTLDVFPQVPVNGFCRYQHFNVAPGFLNSYPLNYNNDSYTDLLLYNPSNNKICSLDGSQNGTFGQSHLFRFQFRISGIQPLRDKDQNITGYAFISRKQNSAGIMKINDNGRPEVESILKFNSYPENLSVADINNDGIPEVLISGSTFDGLSVIYKDRKLQDIKVADRTSYPEAIFTELNNDGYPDIAAFEMFTNKLQFFYNTSTGDFKKVREIPLDSPVQQLQAADIDLDSYNDLIYSDDKEISILYGDFSSSYYGRTTIETKFRVDKFITGDFNSDGRIDVAYLNNEEGILSLIFGKDDRKFYPELIYLKKDSLTDITPYYSKFVNGISLLGENGNLFLISDLTSFSDSVSIIAGAYPTSISYFDKDNNGINDICFIDGFNRTLNLLIRNNSGLPEWWFSLPLFETESSVIVSNRNPRFKTFYCFTWDKKLIEVLTADLKNNIYSRNSLYSPGKIKDLKIKPGNDKLYAAFLKDDYLGVTIFTPRHGRYSAYSIKDIHKNVLDAALSVSGNAEVYYAAVENDSILIGEKFLETDRKESEISTGLNSDYRVLLYAGNFSKKRGSSLYGFLNSEKHNNLAFFLGPKDFIISRENSGIDDFRIIDKNQLFFGELRLNSSVKVYLLDDNLHAIYSLDQGESKINHDLIAGDIFARSFFVKNMNTQAFHLVYINKNENCITIKELK